MINAKLTNELAQEVYQSEYNKYFTKIKYLIISCANTGITSTYAEGMSLKTAEKLANTLRDFGYTCSINNLNDSVKLHICWD